MRSADTMTRQRLRPFGFVSRRLGNQVALAAAGGLVVMAAVFALLVWTANSQTGGVIAEKRLKLAQATAGSIDALVVHATRQLAQFAALDTVRDMVAPSVALLGIGAHVKDALLACAASFRLKGGERAGAGYRDTRRLW